MKAGRDETLMASTYPSPGASKSELAAVIPVNGFHSKGKSNRANQRAASLSGSQKNAQQAVSSRRARTLARILARIFA